MKNLCDGLVLIIIAFYSSLSFSTSASIYSINELCHIKIKDVQKNLTWSYASLLTALQAKAEVEST